MDILRFADLLPKGEQPHIVSEQFGLQPVADERIDFVSPQLQLISTGGEQPSPAALITAPAAAGKSTSAQMIASRSGALLLDLARQRVADGSFVGLLLEALDDEPAAHFRASIRSGQAALIIDSLDESQLVSGEANFVAFLRGLCRFLRLSQGENNVVLMARVDTAEWIAGTFEDEGVALNQYVIDYFDKDSADKFIDLKLDKLYKGDNDSAKPHRRHRTKFTEVREQIYSRVAAGLDLDTAAVWEDDEARRFLGYSPVLESISSYMAVPDFRELNPIAGSSEEVSTDAPEWRILSSLTNALLLREQGRLHEGWLDSVNRAMFPDQVAIDQLYAPDEQCQRLISQVLQNRGVTLPVELPQSLRTSYEDAVSTQLRNHPFLATGRTFVSTILRDYAFASVLTNPRSDENIRKMVLRALRDDSALPSPAVAPFMTTLLSTAGRPLPLDVCDLLITSLASQRDWKSDLQYRIFSQDRHGFFEASRTDRVTNVETRVFQVDLEDYRRTGQFTLPPRVANLTLDFDGDVELSSSREIAHIGPHVSIRAREIISDSRTLRVANDVTLEAALVMSGYNQDVRAFDRFVVYADEVEGPLFAWLKTAPREDGSTSLTPEFYALRRLLRFFRRTVHAGPGHLAADSEQLRRYVLGSDQVAARLVSGLARRGLIREVGPAMILESETITSRGLNFRDVDAYITNPRLQAFLEGLLER